MSGNTVFARSISDAAISKREKVPPPFMGGVGEG